MDYDLFEVDTDEFLCSVPDEELDRTEQLESINHYPMLNCCIKDVSTNRNFPHDSFIKSLFIFKENLANLTENEELRLTNYEFRGSHLVVDDVSEYVLRHARMYIQILATNLKESLECDDQSYFQQRRQVTLMYHTIIMQNELISSSVLRNLSSIRRLLKSLANKEILSLICVPDGAAGNESKSAAHHFLHGFLEWRFLDLVLNKEKQNHLSINENDEDGKDFVQHYEAFMNDLFMISFCYFKKNKLTDIVSTCCFPCVCVREMWLLLQLLSEKYEIELNFWKSFIELLTKSHQTYSTDISKQDLMLFQIWLIKDVLMLEGYKKNGVFEGPTCSRISNNYELVEKTTELFLNSEPSEERVRIFLVILMPIILDWWNVKVDIPMILWEYFCKKINSAFYIAGSAPSSLAISSSTGRGYLERIKFLLSVNPSITSSSDDSSFTLFLMILGRIIEKFIHNSQINQIHKVLGRIFIKFSLSKLLTLNEIGIHHLIELFLMMIISSQLKEIAYKLKDKLLSIALDKISINQRNCITKGHLAFIIYFFEENYEVSDYIKKLLEQLSSINNDLTVSKLIIDGMCDVLRISKSFNKGEHLFIDVWLSNFLNTCTSVEMERILEVFHTVFDKMKTITIESSSSTMMTEISSTPHEFIEKPIEFFNALSNHILPFIKHSLSTVTSSSWIPLLAADFCILITSFHGKEQFQRQFKSCLEATSYNIRSMLKLLLAVLDCDYLIEVDSTTTIQMWLKSVVLLSASDEDVINLSKKVAELKEFQDISNLKVEDLISSKEPLLIFISAVGRNYDSCDNLNKKSQISDRFNSYLISFDKWILDKNEKTEVSYRFYSFIAVVIFNCAKMVYVRSKITCFFHIAMTRFILPCSIQVGKVPDFKLCQIIHKILPVLLQGIGKLNFNGDPYITKTLTDLITKWTPHFKSLKNGKIFANCISNENESLSIFIFEKLASTFLTTQKRQPQTNSMIIVTIFKEILLEIGNNENKLSIFIKSTIFVIFEHLLMIDSTMPINKMLLDLFEKITKSIQTLKSESIRLILIEKIQLIVIKHLAHCSVFCFQLLTQLANIYAELIEDILPFLEQQVKIVEEKRGSECDNRLRNCLEKLKGTILATKMKTSKN